MSTVAERILACLDHKPRTTREIAQALGIAVGHCGATLRVLRLRGDVSEVMAEGLQKERLVSAWKLAKPIDRRPTVVRPDYTGEPLPLRYVPRDEPYISLGRIGD